ncbi:hypothetical protein IJI29_00725 [Candidatus Saccharibacteria bacterium]|nr:hypothetical protein [Candidatus Saccharibacteria bacterium]
MKAKKIFLFVTCIIFCILFAACNENNTPIPTETKSFVQEKVEEAGFKVTKTENDNTLPTMESLPDDVRRLASDAYSLSANLIPIGIGDWNTRDELTESLREHSELCPQIALMVSKMYADAGGKVNEIDPSAIAELKSLGEKHGLWS